MWLPREERYLLMVYTALDPNFSKPTNTFQIEDLRWVLVKHMRHGEVVKRASELRERKEKVKQEDKDTGSTKTDTNSHNTEDRFEKYMSWLRAKATIESVNNRLKERDLIELHDCGTGFYNAKIKLAGWDLGDKYNSWWSRNVLWFREYKDHWIWIIVSFLGGVIGALLIDLLSRGTNGE